MSANRPETSASPSSRRVTLKKSARKISGEIPVEGKGSAISSPTLLGAQPGFAGSPMTESLERGRRPSRVVIDRIQPEVDGGRFPAKRFIDEPIALSATILIDGHDHLKARLLYRHDTESKYKIIPLVSEPNDQWVASFQPEKLGRYWVTVEASLDRFETWRSDITKKLAAGQSIDLDLVTGQILLESWIQYVKDDLKSLINEKIRKLREWSDSKKSPALNELSILLEDPILEKFLESNYEDPSTVRLKREVPIQVEPKLARFSSWYEFFPRSASQVPGEHGTLKDAEARLDYVKKMGFDIVYFPPIHPIGTAFRKGKNNSLTTVKGDVGSPWAIGSKEGGHRAIHPQLGTVADFDRLMAKAKSLGIEIALDIAFQCSPDHPYVQDHPDWFKKRPDGTIQYAENPPKKYQDIYPFDFESADWRNLWKELRDVVQYWVNKGVRVFRVDNPHTKALHFWEWMIKEIKDKHPDVIFLSEAFTRPQLMAYLAKVGFSQSYTYFSWRTTKWELTQYLTELTQTELIEYFGPNFWPNTPDILPGHLQAENRGIYMQRLVLAATLSSNYGIYGPVYELMVHAPVVTGKEEYLDSEKYQLQHWNLDQPQSLAPFISRINEIRKQYPALQNNRSLRFHSIPNEMLIAYSKTDGEERILTVVNLDPQNVQSGMVELPLIEWGIDPSETFEVHDLLTDSRYFWRGWRNYVELNPQTLPAHILLIKKQKNAGVGDVHN